MCTRDNHKTFRRQWNLMPPGLSLFFVHSRLHDTVIDITKSPGTALVWLWAPLPASNNFSIAYACNPIFQSKDLIASHFLVLPSPPLRSTGTERKKERQSYHRTRARGARRAWVRQISRGRARMQIERQPLSSSRERNARARTERKRQVVSVGYSIIFMAIHRRRRRRRSPADVARALFFPLPIDARFELSVYIYVRELRRVPIRTYSESQKLLRNRAILNGTRPR